MALMLEPLETSEELDLGAALDQGLEGLLFKGAEIARDSSRALPDNWVDGAPIKPPERAK